MARIPYADLEQPEIRPIVDAIVAQRGTVLHLYRMLLQSPPVAEGWLAFLTAIRHRCTLPGDVRELVIMRIAIVNGAPYEADQHAPIALKEGLTQAQLDALADWSGSDRFTPSQRAVLALADSMTRDVHVPDAVFEGVRPHFTERELVELVATIAAYNMVSRFLEALAIHSDDRPGADPGRPKGLSPGARDA
jgi:AhpD family alkylhydroperoxidase